MKKIKINNFYLTENSKTFIMAEIGLNHNGDIELAKKLIKKAKECGADAVKFQIYNTDLFINRKYAPGQYDLLKKYEISFDKFKLIKSFCDKNGIIFFASPFDIESANFLLKLKVPIIKIASSELSNKYFLNHVARFQIPLFLSTGLHDFHEIKTTIKEIEKVNKRIVVLYCVSEYPLRYEDANLNVLKLYKESFNHLVGFSDHSEEWLLDVIAVGMGAKVIEKHFTLDKNLPGPDHKIALNPDDFRTMTQNIRKAENSLGIKEKRKTQSEKKIRPNALKGVYARKSINKGDVLSVDNVIMQRPLKGIPAGKFRFLLGKKATKNYINFGIIKEKY